MVDTGGIPIDMSRGRQPGGAAEWVLFAEPTPGAANTTAISQGLSDTVEASLPGGFYDQPIDLVLMASAAEADIRFTLDGSAPTLASDSYSSSLTIASTRVVRARTFANGQPTSPILTRTYFIGEEFTMPVVSLSTDPQHLWDEDLGIYTPGRNARESQRIANYWNDWERPAHVELFEPDGTSGFGVDAGVQIFGWGSRSNPQKSLSIMFRNKYGASELEYALFPDLPIDRFTAFVLRAAGGDSSRAGTFFRDPYASSLVVDRNLDYQAFRPAVVFINGEYWGIQNIREKMNEDYLASHHGVDPDQLDLISRYWRRTYPVVIEGDATDYLGFEEFLESADLADSENYDQVKALMDIDSFLDYTVAEIYFGNYDWPGNNNKNWKAKTPGAKWRWLMYDLDYTFGSNGNQNDYTFNTLEHCLEANGAGWPNPSWTTLILRRLLTSPEFRRRFINRTTDLINTTFVPETALAKLASMQSLFAPEMPRHIQRWQGTGNVIPSVSTWEDNIDTVETFVRRRPEHVLEHVRQHFSLSGQI